MQVVRMSEKTTQLTKQMREERRSQCPFNLTLEMLGDRWSLIVIRDVMFGNHRHYGDLLKFSEEGIASNILADRLGRLMRAGLLTRTGDPTHKQKAIYSLTESAIDLVPLIAQMIAWGRKHLSGTVLNPKGQILEKGGDRMWRAFEAELRAIHLGAPAPRRWIFFDRPSAFASVIKQRPKASERRRRARL